MCCLRSEAIHKRLLTENALTLERTVEISVSMELAAKESHQLSSSTKLHKIANETHEKQKNAVASECWRKDLDCRKCGKKGHIEHACKSKRTTSKNTRKEPQGQIY